MDGGADDGYSFIMTLDADSDSDTRFMAIFCWGASLAVLSADDGWILWIRLTGAIVMGWWREISPTGLELGGRVGGRAVGRDCLESTAQAGALGCLLRLMHPENCRVLAWI